MLPVSLKSVGEISMPRVKESMLRISRFVILLNVLVFSIQL